MNVHWLEIGQVAALVGGAAAIPPVVRRLPEPVAPALPPVGAPEESELDRMLRDEGPTETYAAMATHLRRGWWAVWPLVILGGFAVHIEPIRIAWVGLALVPVFALLTVVDWRRRLLPRIVVRPVTAVLVVVALIDWIARRDSAALLREAVGALVAWLIFGVLWFIRRAGMGLGDVRLALPLGMLTAAVSWNAWLIGLYAGFVGFAVFGVALVLVTRDRRVLKRAYPFGPFMIVGAYAGMALAPHWHLVG